MSTLTHPLPHRGLGTGPDLRHAVWARGRACQWHYQAVGKRDLRIDFLRGFAVFAMVVDHMGVDSPLLWLTGGNRFFVSAAEGFVLISGLMVGLVYPREIERGGLWAATVKALKRAWTLYALAVWLALAFAGASLLLGLPWAPDLAAGGWPVFVLGLVTAHQTFYLVDVMLLYTFLLGLAPLALWAMRRGRTAAMLAVSIGVWVGYQLWPGPLSLPWPIVDNPVFNLAAWQLLFFAGMALGYHRQRLGAWAAKHRATLALPGGWLPGLSLGLLGLIWLQATNGAALDAVAPQGDGAALLDAWFDKSTLPLPRLLACAIVFGFAWSLSTTGWRPLSYCLGPVLEPLGSRTLYAYAAHPFVVTALWLTTAQLPPAAAWLGADAAAVLAPWLNAATQLAGVAALWLLVRYRVGQRLLEPLGAAPLAPARGPWLQPTASLIAVGLLVAASAGGAAAGVATGLGDGQVAGAGGQRHVVATVTAPHRVAGAARALPVDTSLSTDADAFEAPAWTELPTPADGLVSLAAGLVPAAPAAESVGYLRDEEFFSPILDRVMPYGVYLPAGYTTSTRRYPVLYLLHGMGGYYSELVDYGFVAAADQLIADGEIPPLIIVMPQGDESYWINWADGGPRWADYVADDVVRHVDATYRTVPTARGRAIGGLSMGGYGALQLAFNRPDEFAIVGGHSPSLRAFEEELDYFGDLPTYARQDPVTLAAALEPGQAIWLDIGADDGWRERVETLHDVLARRGVHHQYHEYPGDHLYTYWTAHATDYLRYYGTAFGG